MARKKKGRSKPWEQPNDEKIAGGNAAVLEVLEGSVVQICATSSSLCGSLGVVLSVSGQDVRLSVSGCEHQSVQLHDVERFQDELIRPCADQSDLDFTAIQFDCDGKLGFSHSAVKYAVRPIESKGLGVVATHQIFKGERICEDSAVLEFDSKISDAALLPKCVPEAGAEAFWELSDNYAAERNGKTISGIVQTNARPIGDTGLSAVFPLASRFNHSCVPNVSQCWLPEIKREVLHAITDISVGEELTVSYVNPRGCSSSRRRELFDSFRFHCCCSACSSSKVEQDKADVKRRRIVELDRQAIGSNAEESMRLAQEALDIVDSEFLGRPGYKVPHYLESCRSALRLGDVRIAKFMAFKCYEALCYDEGALSSRSCLAYNKQMEVRKIELNPDLLFSILSARRPKTVHLEELD